MADTPSSEPVARVILLGASNLRRSFYGVLRAVHQQLGGPLELFVAHGHGRSYGQRSSIPGRTLPGILECQLWSDVAARPALPTYALLTDVGNDLLYGVAVDQLLAWVEQCLLRLQARKASLVITQLPMESLSTLGTVRYQIFRTIFFPPCRYSLKEITARAKQTNEGLIALGHRYALSTLPLKGAWYGVDPIHVRWRYYDEVWKTLCAAWGDVGLPSSKFRWGLKNRLFLELAAPCERHLFGIQQTCEQPCLVFENGTSLALY